MCTFAHRYIFLWRDEITKKGRIPSEEIDLYFVYKEKILADTNKKYKKNCFLLKKKLLLYRSVTTLYENAEHTIN